MLLVRLMELLLAEELLVLIDKLAQMLESLLGSYLAMQ